MAGFRWLDSGGRIQEAGRSAAVIPRCSVAIWREGSFQEVGGRGQEAGRSVAVIPQCSEAIQWEGSFQEEGRRRQEVGCSAAVVPQCCIAIKREGREQRAKEECVRKKGIEDPINFCDLKITAN